jgi:hypothetical protein
MNKEKERTDRAVTKRDARTRQREAGPNSIARGILATDR